MSPPDLSIIVPTFNEAANVGEVVRRVEAALGATGWELIFVDDDSPDSTAQAVREMARRDCRIRCLQRIGRRGLASACIEGMLSASAPVLAVMDADLQHDAAILPQMRAKIAEERADIVVATRYGAGGGVGGWKASRRRMSELATAISRRFLPHPVSDPMSGFFMLRRELFAATVRRLSGLGFKILLDILLTARDARVAIAEVPYRFGDRHAGESKIGPMILWEFGLLLADKTLGRYLPVRFLAFVCIGSLGLLVHMAVLAFLLKGAGVGFTAAQTCATLVAMVFNFSLNNILTYRDRRLHGLLWFRGLASFILACSIGALANVGIASTLFASNTQWTVAALAGIVIGAVWNYAVTQLFTWGRPRAV